RRLQARQRRGLRGHRQPAVRQGQHAAFVRRRQEQRRRDPARPRRHGAPAARAPRADVNPARPTRTVRYSRRAVLALAPFLLVAATSSPIPAHAVIAHRGASYDAPEETAVAFELARALGADY